MNDLLSRIIVKKRFLNKLFRFFHEKTLTICLSKHMNYCIDPHDLSGPSFYLAYTGEAAFYHYEVPVKSAILRFLPENGIFFDVGANIGLISFFMAKFRPDCKIISFEPDVVTSECFEKNIEIQNSKNVQLVKKGISNLTKDNYTFFIDNRSSGGNSLEKSAIANIQKEIKIDLITLDDFSSTTNIIPDVIKIDVQDHERFVLFGAQTLIAKYRPVVIVETNNKLLLDNFDTIQQIFNEYLVSDVNGDSWGDLSEWKILAKNYLDKDILTIDYVLRPKEK
jgi:FkbM family methyltransferase